MSAIVGVVLLAVLDKLVGPGSCHWWQCVALAIANRTPPFTTPEGTNARRARCLSP